MRRTDRSICILMADDDEDDRLLTRDALSGTGRLRIDLRFAVDGEDLLDYLCQRGRYAAPGTAPRPGLILLDLNMPKKDGREALAEIKADASLRRTPVVVLTTSRAEEDIVRSYDLGVSSFITKPVTFDGLVAVMHTLGEYWLDVVELPLDGRRAR